MLGVLVLALPMRLQKTDAYSVWAGSDPRRPVIVLSGGGDLGATVGALHHLEDVTVQGLSVRRDDDLLRVEADLVGPPGVALADLLAPLAERADVARLDVH
jgi:hypothetical protein